MAEVLTQKGALFFLEKGSTEVQAECDNGELLRQKTRLNEGDSMGYYRTMEDVGSFPWCSERKRGT
jgi:hypothetical protein